MNGSSEICAALIKRPRYRQPRALIGAIPVADTAENHAKAWPNERVNRPDIKRRRLDRD